MQKENIADAIMEVLDAVDTLLRYIGPESSHYVHICEIARHQKQMLIDKAHSEGWADDLSLFWQAWPHFANVESVLMADNGKSD